MKTEFSEEIKKIRSHFTSQKKAAAELDCTAQYLSMVESGRRVPPDNFIHLFSVVYSLEPEVTARLLEFRDLAKMEHQERMRQSRLANRQELVQDIAVNVWSKLERWGIKLTDKRMEELGHLIDAIVRKRRKIKINNA